MLFRSTDREGGVWIRSSEKLLLWRPGSARFVRQDRDLPASGYCADLYFDRKGRLLLPTDQGLARLRDGRWERIDSSRGLPSDSACSVMQDREGSLWVGLWGYGVARWQGYERWEAWTHAEGLPSDIVWAVRRDTGGALWIGTDRGLARLDPRSGAVRSWSSAQGLPGEKVRAIAMGADGGVWIGAAPGGVARLEASDGYRRVQRFGVESGITNPRVNGMLMAPDGRLWVSTSDGLFRGDARGRTPDRKSVV